MNRNDEQKVNVLERTFGAWSREESAQETVDSARSAFRQSMENKVGQASSLFTVARRVLDRITG